MRELFTRSGSRHRITRPSFASSIGTHWLESTYSSFRFFSRSSGLMRSGLNGSYGTPKNFARAAPIDGSLTWNSEVRTSSTSTAFLRAERAASSNSAAEITASLTRKSYLVLSTCGFWRCLSAIASVWHSSVTPSSASWPKGTPVLLLISWTTPTSSELPGSATGATSICLVRYPVRLSTSWRKRRWVLWSFSSPSSYTSLRLSIFFDRKNEARDRVLRDRQLQ